jgi:hypothetical protein
MILGSSLLLTLARKKEPRPDLTLLNNTCESGGRGQVLKGDTHKKKEFRQVGERYYGGYYGENPLKFRVIGYTLFVIREKRVR